MFVKIENGVLITAKTVHTPMGVFNSDSAEAPDGWSIVADTEVSPADEMNNNGVPQIVTARQARLALNAAGLLDNIDAELGKLPRDAQIEWQYAHEIRRDSPLIAAVGSALGLDNEAIDALFAQASTL